MNRIPVFISFDFEHDSSIKDQLVSEWQKDQCPIWIKDYSLPGPVNEGRWQSEAGKRIELAKVVLVICGKNTHSADGVKIEVQMARQKEKPVLFLKGLKEGASLPTGVAKTERMIPLDWASVYEELKPLANR
jgi:hypothetical protein